MKARFLSPALCLLGAFAPVLVSAQEWEVREHGSAAAGRYLASVSAVDNTEITAARSVAYSVAVPTAGVRRFWTRYRTTGGAAGTLHVAINDSAYVQVDLPAAAEWRWVVLAQSELTVGTHTFRIVRGKANVELDRFYHTVDLAVFPLGRGGQVDEFGPPLTLAAWTAAHTWPRPGIDDAAGADPDGDGKTNRMEYLWGADPLVADASAPEFRPVEGGGFAFRLSRPKHLAELVTKVQRSVDLALWTDLAPSDTRVVGETEEAEIVEVVFPASALSGQRSFFRIVHP